MKADIHPKYNSVEASCVCGNVILTGSTKAQIKMEICSGCHPFFTGTQKIIDTEGRVEKFKKRFAAVQTQKKVSKKDRLKSKEEPEVVAEKAPEAKVEAPVVEAAAPVVAAAPAVEVEAAAAPEVAVEAPAAEVEAPEAAPEA